MTIQQPFPSRVSVKVPNNFHESKLDFISLGFNITEREDEVLLELPVGWKLSEETDEYGTHFFVDEKGRKRGSYSENMFMNYGVHLYNRYNIVIKDMLAVVDYDGRVLKTFESGWLRSAWKKAQKYLDKNFPEWEDPLMYWEKN